MAKYNAGYLSPIKNKLGNAVGRKWRNLNILSVYQPDVSNPRTTAQQLNRAEFKAVSSLGRMMRRISVLGFRNFCAGTKVFPRAMFVKLNKSIATADSVDSVTIDYSEMVVSRGSLPKLTTPTPGFSEPQKVVLDWDTPALEAAYTSEEINNMYAFIAVVNGEAGEVVYSNTEKVGSKSAEVDVPSHWNGMNVKVYVFVQYKGADVPSDGLKNGDVSDSVYCGSGAIG